MNSKHRNSSTIRNRSAGLLAMAVVGLSSASSAAAPIATAFARAPGSIAVSQPGAMTSATASLDLHQLLAERRSTNLDRLLQYAQAGVFPQNTVSAGPLNVFIDGQGHICAAANLIHQDGYQALVQDTAAHNNYIVLSSVKEGPLLDWMLTSGFTQEEIGLIQEPYMPIGEFPLIDDPSLPEPVFVTTAVTQEDERERVQAVLLGVHAILQANSQKSLAAAVVRLQANPRALEAQAGPPARAPQPRFAKAP